jgi:DEAD/DEAH box helicase domain-containing protein
VGRRDRLTRAVTRGTDSGPARPRPSVATRGPESILGDERVVHRAAIPARRRTTAPLPDDLPGEVRALLAESGIEALHRFQADAIDLVRAGRSVVLAGGTGAGKSLCYQVPLLELLHAPGEDGRKRTALYLAPTKSLAQDQARRLRELGAPWAVPMLYDGDTPAAQRAQVRRRANLLLTNPDMLSAGILPAHEEWAVFLRGLALVVIDESHVYRGVFGSHVAQVLRRLRRLLARHGNTSCRFVLSSATTGNPVAHAERLVGVDVRLVDDRGAPRAARDVLIWAPHLDEETGDRDSAIGDAVRIYVELVEQGLPTIVFARSRRQCELVHRFAGEHLRSRGLDELADRIAPYRAGYTPQERRETERALASGELLGVVATSALELGIDIGSLQASVVLTYPGTTTSLLQRWGRAGRSAGARGLCVLVGGDDALDQYFLRNPVELLERPVEDAVISLDNDRILLPHVAAAAAEAPVAGAADDEVWPDGRWQRAVERLLEQGQVRDTPAGAVFVGRGRAAAGISLRSTGRGDVQIVDADTGAVLGTVEVGRAATTVHAGAVYLHRGESYLVEHLDVAHLVATVRRRTLPYYTMPKVDTDIEVLEVLHERPLAGTGLVLRHGRVVVEDQLVGYQRMDTTSHRVLGVIDEVLPPIAFETEAVWLASPLPPPPVAEPIDPDDPLGERRFLGSLHAAEHALIAMLPLVATCDRWDIGGLSINWHEAFDGAGIFVYDGHAGGVGITEAGFARFESWAGATLAMLEGCPCEDGCPSCVQSPKCGNLNDPLDKQGAIDVLAAALGERSGWTP